MIYALKLQAYLINKFLVKEQKIETKEWKPETPDDKQITAAITAAIIHHNNKG
jgi:Na+-transporting methylmalonyl-CoA/oxaloacetate decarboxylase gamma subunit